MRTILSHQSHQSIHPCHGQISSGKNLGRGLAPKGRANFCSQNVYIYLSVWVSYACNVLCSTVYLYSTNVLNGPGNGLGLFVFYLVFLFVLGWLNNAGNADFGASAALCKPRSSEKKKKNSNKASKVSCQMANAWWPLTIHRYTYLQVLCLHVSEKTCRLFASTICGVVAGFMSTCFLL